MSLLVHPWQKDPKITKHCIGDDEVKWTLVMPIFNQEENIYKILKKIYINAQLKFNAILINDASDDKSIVEINNFINFIKEDLNRKVMEVTLIDNPVPIFETACDNQGFRNSLTEFIIEIQSDIHIEESGFDKKMIAAMELFNLGAISGRHVHAYSLIENNRAWFKYPISLIKWRLLKIGHPEGVGKLGKKIFEKINTVDLDCYIGETVARGPFLIRRSDLISLSYLDEKNFFLGNDDHDYCRRIYLKFGKNVGYVPMNIYSIPADGSTRKIRTGLNKKIFEYLKLNKTGSKEFTKFMRNYRPFLQIKKYKI